MNDFKKMGNMDEVLQAIGTIMVGFHEAEQNQQGQAKKIKKRRWT